MFCSSPTSRFHRQLRICYIIESLALAGAEKRTRDLILALDRQRYAPLVVCTRELGMLAPSLLEAGIPVIKKAKPGPWGSRTFLEFMRTLRAAKPDVIHVQSFGDCLWEVAAARLAGLGAVVRSRNNLAHWRDRKGAIKSFLAGLLCTINVGISRSVVEDMHRNERIPRSRLHVVYSGVSTEVFRPLSHSRVLHQRFAIPSGRRVVGTIANLKGIKRLDLFLRVAERVVKRMHAVVFVIIGSGNEERLKYFARLLRIRNSVVFAGKQVDVHRLLPGFDVFVSTSNSEGLGMVHLEAMAAGKPVVSTCSGGPEETVVHGETGYLTPVGEVEPIAEAVIYLLKNPQRAREMGIKGRRRVQRLFSLDRMVASYEKLYLELAG